MYDRDKEDHQWALSNSPIISVHLTMVDLAQRYGHWTLQSGKSWLRNLWTWWYHISDKPKLRYMLKWSWMHSTAASTTVFKVIGVFNNPLNRWSQPETKHIQKRCSEFGQQKSLIFRFSDDFSCKQSCGGLFSFTLILLMMNHKKYLNHLDHHQDENA